MSNQRGRKSNIERKYIDDLAMFPQRTYEEVQY